MQPQNPTDHNFVRQPEVGEYLLPGQSETSDQSIDGLTYEATRYAQIGPNSNPNDLEALRATGAVIYEQATGAPDKTPRKPAASTVDRESSTATAGDRSTGAVDLEKNSNSLYIDTLIIGENIRAARRYKSSGVNPSPEELIGFHRSPVDQAGPAIIRAGDDKSNFAQAA